MTTIPQLRKPDPGRINCKICHAENTPGCTRCKQCTYCGCRCYTCKECSKEHGKTIFHARDSRCQLCGKCRQVCRCRKAPKNILLTPPLGVFKENKLQRFLGLEIELYPVGDFYGLRWPKWVKFELVRDGSVTHGGQEMVVYPMIGDQFLSGVSAIHKNLTLRKCGVDETCGFHVHVQGQDYGAFELRRLIWLYTKLEKEIFSTFCTPERIGSRFCKPYLMDEEWFKRLWGFQTSAEIRDFLIRWLYSETLRPRTRYTEDGQIQEIGGFRNLSEIRNHKYEACRYHGLNLHTWFQRQTLEFRQHQGTLDKERLTYWPLFCGWFVELCGALQDSEIRQISTLRELIWGSWKRPYRILEMPKNLREWVRSL